MSELYSDTLRVSWLKPAEVNGVLKNYRVRHWRNDSLPYTPKETLVSNVSISAVITGLSPQTLYTVEVAAVTRVGPGTALRLVARTLSSPGNLFDKLVVFPKFERSQVCLCSKLRFRLLEDGHDSEEL